MRSCLRMANASPIFLQAHQTSCAANKTIKQAFECAVLEELFGGLQNGATELVRGLISGVGNLCATTAESLSGGTADEDVVAVEKATSAALGAAIRSMGPAAVLQVLPLNLMVRTLSPLPSRDYIINCQLCRNIHSRKSGGFYFLPAVYVMVISALTHMLTANLILSV